MKKKLIPTVYRPREDKSFLSVIGKAILFYAILIAFALLFIFPFYYVIVLATRRYNTIFDNPPPFLFGGAFLVNLQTLLRQIPFIQNFTNSVVIAILATGTKIFFCTIAGFVLAKYRFKGRNLILALILFTLTMPKFILIIPLFRVMISLNWINTYFPMFVPNMADGLGIFLMTQIFENSVTAGMIDSARIDGMNEYQIILRLGFPLGAAGLFVLGTISFINSWNDFMYALIMLPNHSAHTLPVALNSLNIMAEGDFGALMMGSMLSMAPLIIVIIIFGKRIISNMLAGSIRGA
ncbi:MAG: carbohydrate ABC transporter permease [Spirochaetales bacterium]|nr:carbohydrate ABC transporter permease [Spirochaetales bacterium]